MKKSIAILSMALLAGNAFATDVLEVGTVAAPKYYVIKANRGNPYVTYTATAKDNNGASTTLYRANELSEAAVWAVVAGTEEGTVNIYSYTTRNDENKAYMFSFATKDGSEFTGASNSGTATTGEAQDVFVMDNGNGSYGFALKNLNGFYNSSFWGLDATNNSEFLGNWYSCKDGGTQWWVYAFDEATGIEGVEKSILKDAIASYSNSLTAYAAAVPWVADELNAGITALNQIEYSADYQAQITSVWNQYIGNADAALNTMFNGKQVAFQNQRRKANGKAKPFISVGETNYPGAENYATDPNAIFTLESTTANDKAAYYMYNAATQTYYGAAKAPVATKEEATTISFTLNSNSGFTGVNIIADGVSGNMNGLNVDQNGNPLTYWYPADGGSIWSILEADEESRAEYITSSSIEKLQPYVDKVPEKVAGVLNAGIDQIKALPLTDDLAEKAEAIVANTIAAANELLTYGEHGTTVNIYYPRGGRYLGYSAESSDWVAATSNNSNNEIFTIRNVEGGVILYNAENNVYVGPAVSNGNQYDIQPVTEKAEATVFTVELNSNSGYYGVSFVYNDENLGERALNMNLNAKCLHTYGKADGGSIFVLKDKEIEPVLTPVTGEATATYDFLTDQYGYNVESGNSGSYLPADAEFLEEDGRCHITIDKANGAGVRFWQASSGVELRVMKNSAITISVPQGDILGVEFTANKNANLFTSSNSDLIALGGTSKLCTFANIGGTVSTVTFTAKDRVDLTQIKVNLEGGVAYVPVTPVVREDAGLAIEGGETEYTTILGEEFVAPVIIKETFSKLTFTSSNTEVAEIDADGSNLNIVGVGTAVITATAPENDDYEAGKISYTINVLPEGVIFSSAMGEDFTFEPDADIWVHDAKYGLKGTGYVADLKMNIIAEAIAVSPEITIPAGTEATLYFDQAINFLKGNPIANYCNVVVRVTDEGEGEEEGGYYDTEEEDSEWVLIENAVIAPASDGWTFYANDPVDLTEFAGKTIQIGFKYNSTTEVGCTWEINNIMVTAIDPLKAKKEAAIAELTKYVNHLPGDHSWSLIYYAQTINECTDAEDIDATVEAILGQLASQYANNLELNFFFAVGDKFGAYVKPAAEGVNAWQVVNELGGNAVFAGKRVNERSWMPWSATDAEEGEAATERESNNEDAMILYNVLTGYYLGQPTAAGEAIPVVEEESEAAYWFVKPIDGQFAIADDANGELYLFWDETKGLIASETAATFPADEIPVWDNGYCDYYVSVVVPTTGTDEWGRPVAEEINEFDVYVSTEATLTGIGGIQCYSYDYRTDERITFVNITAAQLAELTPEKATGIYKKTVGWSATGAIYEEIEFEANRYHVTIKNDIMGRAKGDEEGETGITTPGDYYFETLEGTWIVSDENEGKLFSPEVHEQVSILGELPPVAGFAIESDPVDGATLDEISSIFLCPENDYCTIVWTNPEGTNIVFSSGENVIKTWTPEDVQNCALEKEDFWNDPDIFELKLDETITAAGTYSLYIPEGFFEDDNSTNAETILTWTIEEGEDGITNITVKGNDAIYDLQGRRMNAASKGIFIINGKKVLVK